MKNKIEPPTGCKIAKQKYFDLFEKAKKLL